MESWRAHGELTFLFGGYAMVDPGVFDDLGVPLERDVALGPMTWYGVGGRASLLARPGSHDHVGSVYQRAGEAGVPVYVLGSGANLLVADGGVGGVVLRLDAPVFGGLRMLRDGVVAGAGLDLARLVLATAKAGLGGLECLAGIPASVGGALRMNAGGAFGDIGDRVKQVTVCDPSGRICEWGRDELAFGYRSSNLDGVCVLEAEFGLELGDAEEIRSRVKEVFRYKKASQPLADQSAGCAFKNPRGPIDGFEMNRVGCVSAGALIDRAGLKGHRVGGAEVSVRHANFIVAHPGCRAADIIAVMGDIEKRVADVFGVVLEREVVVWS